MGWEARVEFKGLASAMLDLKGRARKMMPLTGQMTKGLMEAHHALYVENLSGSQPSTAARPLPVGVRTGLLRSRAQKRQLNQYSYIVFNDAFYSAFIEDGTRFMVPRRPLGDATDQIERKVPGAANEVVAKVWKV